MRCRGSCCCVISLAPLAGGDSPRYGGEQDDGRDPREDPLEAVEHRSRHRVLGIREIPLEIRASDCPKHEEDKGRRGSDRDAKDVQRAPLGFPCSRELVVQHFELFGESLQSTGLGRGNGLAQQRAHRGFEHLSEGDEYLRVGHREPAFPFGNRLPHHVQLERELLLR